MTTITTTATNLQSPARTVSNYDTRLTHWYNRLMLLLLLLMMMMMMTTTMMIRRIWVCTYTAALRLDKDLLKSMLYLLQRKQYGRENAENIFISLVFQCFIILLFNASVLFYCIVCMRIVSSYIHVHCVPKNIPDIFDCNLKINQQILIIFGKNISDTTCYQTTI